MSPAAAMIEDGGRAKEDRAARAHSCLPRHLSQRQNSLTAPTVRVHVIRPWWACAAAVPRRRATPIRRAALAHTSATAPRTCARPSASSPPSGTRSSWWRTATSPPRSQAARLARAQCAPRVARTLSMADLQCRSSHPPAPRGRMDIAARVSARAGGPRQRIRGTHRARLHRVPRRRQLRHELGVEEAHCAARQRQRVRAWRKSGRSDP